MKLVLFVCGRNASRSQMAEAYFNHVNKNVSVRGASAGVNPSGTIDENAVTALLEDGIDIRNNPDYSPKTLSDEMLTDAVAIYTMGCNVACDNIGAPITGDFALEDPHGKTLSEALRIYGMLKEKMKPIIEKYNS